MYCWAVSGKPKAAVASATKRIIRTIEKTPYRKTPETVWGEPASPLSSMPDPHAPRTEVRNCPELSLRGAIISSRGRNHNTR
jgi:hypothetical protein